ncbi:hypothetical protein [Pseudoruegeria sp. HB172150]|uniref:hypothetical protein n=1 Tax=Pseudoruegeria sp. HB172150 TaxID=2721164 RepID=UPI0015518C8B|nr:hypothetical protein [Pseudoruegeria sp. HB172150]
MTIRLVIALVLVTATASCGGLRESNLNPFNWFGGSQPARTITVNTYSDPRPLVDQIVDLRMEKIPGGAIIHATGLPARQGYFDGDLVPLNGGVPIDGVLAFQFRIVPPPTPTRVSTQQSREVVIGTYISDQALAPVRVIHVSGARNALSVRR